MNIGDVGCGKSTSLNWMFKRYIKLYQHELNGHYQENNYDQIFGVGDSALSVTKEISQFEIGRLCLIDTPGQNDPDYEKNGLSDTNINIMITE